MRSKTSFFHKGLAANLFKRCWPVWVGYLLLMVLMFPVSVNNQNPLLVFKQRKSFKVSLPGFRQTFFLLKQLLFVKEHVNHLQRVRNVGTFKGAVAHLGGVYCSPFFVAAYAL